MLAKLLFAVAAFAACVSAIPIDNGVIGDPEIFCGPTGIQVSFDTQNPFEGHVYVKNRFAEEECRASGDRSRSIGQIELDFAVCGVSRERSLEPAGVFVRSTIVISFHPRFLTKIDRAYTIQCFYMEADKTVSADIEVSMITTGFQTQVVPMPVCRYEILDAPDGDIVQFGIIGQPVFHKWTCDTDTIDTFCMTVHSCTVDDGQGDVLQLIDEDGCGIDRYLIGNIEYPSDLMGIKEAHVFKYADRPALFFSCQINILVKEPNAECQRPQCSEPGGRGDGSGGTAFLGRFKRSLNENSLGTVDVTTPELSIFDIRPQYDGLPASLSLPHVNKRTLVLEKPQQGICVAPTTVYLCGLLIASALIVAIVCGIVMLQRRK